MTFRVLLSIISLGFFLGFGQQDDYHKDERIEAWFKRIKEEIKLNTSRTVDSINYVRSGPLLNITHYHNTDKIHKEIRSFDTTLIFGISKYGEDTRFEFRRINRENNLLGAEGLTYNNKEYGPWIQVYSNGNPMTRGYYYDGVRFGHWIYYSEGGQIDSIVNKGKGFFADSILFNKRLQTSKKQRN